MKKLTAQEIEAVCSGLDTLAQQIGLVALRLRDDAKPDSATLLTEAKLLEWQMYTFREGLRRHVDRPLTDPRNLPGLFVA